MNEIEKTLAWLAGVGIIVAVGKALTTNEPLTFKLVVGRAILGGALSTIAGVALLMFPEVPFVALIGIASALGILGEQFLGVAVRKILNFKFGVSK